MLVLWFFYTVSLYVLICLSHSLRARISVRFGSDLYRNLQSGTVNTHNNNIAANIPLLPLNRFESLLKSLYGIRHMHFVKVIEENDMQMMDNISYQVIVIINTNNNETMS